MPRTPTASPEPRPIRTDHGFRFGAAEVTALATLPRGVSVTQVKAGACCLRIRVAKTGRMRVYCNGLEVLCTQLARAGKR